MSNANTDERPSSTTAPTAEHTSFEELGLSEATLRAVRDAGYTSPTPVQSGAVPHALLGGDLCVQSQTGTGKTAAFSMPLIEQISKAIKAKGRTGVSALILAPTRELAHQVAQELTRLSEHHTLSVCTVYGGTPFDPQVTAISQADVVVGTPGRVVDHLKRRTLNLNTLKHFVLDEADEMLSMGFAEELEQVRKRLPKERQTLFFSATFPPAVKRYAERTLRDPLLLSFLSEVSSADDLTHAYYMITSLARVKPLVKILIEENPKNAIIFVNTRKDCELVSKALNRAGLTSDRLSGDMDQPERERVMKLMKDKKLRFLVATDVAARGIDISQLSHVVHFQLPDSPEVYIHRSGRTGRAGEEGTVLSLVGPQELSVLYALKRFHHLKLQERPVPTGPSALPKATRPAKAEPAKAEPAKAEPPQAAEPPRSPAPRAPSRDKRPERPPAPARAPARVSSRDKRPERPSERPSELAALSREAQALAGDRFMSEARALLQDPEALDLVRALFARASREPAPLPSPAPTAQRKPSLRDTLTLNVGRELFKTPSALRDYIADLSGLLPEDITGVQLRHGSSHIEVLKELSADLIEAVQGAPVQGRTLSVSQRSAR